MLDVLLEGVGSEVVTPPSNNHMISVARSSVLITLQDLNFLVSFEHKKLYDAQYAVYQIKQIYHFLLEFFNFGKI